MPGDTNALLGDMVGDPGGMSGDMMGGMSGDMMGGMSGD